MNKGWKCGLCGEEWYFSEYQSPANEGIKHIKVEHPDEYLIGAWNLIAIKEVIQ
jgi:hypothetical protein